MEFMEETTIICGNGEETTSNTKAHTGELEAILCNDNQLTDDLVAIHPIVDAGYDIHLSSKGGIINKPSDGHSFPILRDVLKWMIDLEELKARVCGCGNELVQRATYTNETYSPTVAHLTHSTMLQLAIYDQMHMCSIDTVRAFLYQEYPESLKPLYVILRKAVAEVCNLNPKTTYRVKKYIYGLPDSGRAYYIAYRDHSINSSYVMTSADPCLFV
jgi:hypothetical protein